MKKIYLKCIAFMLCMTAVSCNSDFLDEKPQDNIYAENLLVNYDGFVNMNNSLMALVRDEYDRMDINIGGTSFSSMPLARSSMWSCGTDNAWGNNRHSSFKFFSYPKNITSMTDSKCFLSIFEWLYKVINISNMVIDRAENSGVDWQGGSEEANEANKNLIVAEARLYRAWAYRHLTYSFGDVPLSIHEVTGSNFRNDWERNSVSDIRRVMEEDLKYAIEILPSRRNDNTRPSSAIARHYLGELYLAMDKPLEAKNILKPLVEGNDYSLMTERFGKNASTEGSAFMDLFANPLYSEGNKEVLWTFLNTEVENVAYGYAPNIFMRNTWKNYYSNLSDVSKLTNSNYVGKTTKLFWSLNGGKGAGRCAISIGALNLYQYNNQESFDYRYDNNALVWHLMFMNEDGNEYEILKSDNSLINTKPNSAMSNDADPTIKQYNLPSTRKWDYVNPNFESSDEDRQWNNLVYLRLSETYLLYAEALMKLNDPSAVEWINKIRRRANVSDVDESSLDIDFILDERSRELITEEQRRETLIRISQENGGDERKASNIFKSRVRKYNEVAGREVRGMHDDETPVLFPIPKSFIDSNSGRKIEQNPGY